MISLPHWQNLLRVETSRDHFFLTKLFPEFYEYARVFQGFNSWAKTNVTICK